MITTNHSTLTTNTLHKAGESKHQPVARPRSLISGKQMDKINWGPNWEEILGTEFAKHRKADKNFDQVQADMLWRV